MLCALTGRFPPTSPGGRGLSTNQFRDWRPVIDQSHGAVELIWKGYRPRVDSEMMIHGGGDIFRIDGSVDNMFAARVGTTDHLSHLHTAAAHQDAERVSPVISTSQIVHAGRAPEFSHRHDECLVVESAVYK